MITIKFLFFYFDIKIITLPSIIFLLTCYFIKRTLFIKTLAFVFPKKWHTCKILYVMIAMEIESSQIKASFKKYQIGYIFYGYLL